MKYLVIRKCRYSSEEEWQLSSVVTDARYKKSKEELLPLLEKSSNDTNKYEIIDVSDDIAEIIRFLLGEKEYEYSLSLRNLRDYIEELKRSIESVEYNISDMRCSTEDIIEKFDKLIGNNEED